VRGEDGYPLLREVLTRKGPGNQPVTFKLLEMYGLFPFPGDGHIADFVPGFLSPENDYGQKYGLKGYSAWPQELDTERAYTERLGQYRGVSEHIADFYAQPHGRTQAITVIDGIVNDRGKLALVNIPNRGVVTNVAQDLILEVVAVVGAFGIRGLTVGPLPTGVARLVNANLAEQELIVEAALNGDRQLALQAFMADPLCRSVESTAKMLDELLAAHAAYLPRFQ